MESVKRLQIMIPVEMDLALEQRARAEGVSKAELVRRYVGERVRPLPPLHEDPIWELIGMIEGWAGTDDSIARGRHRLSAMIFVDTSFWIAVTRDKDVHHAEAATLAGAASGPVAGLFESCARGDVDAHAQAPRPSRRDDR